MSYGGGVMKTTVGPPRDSTPLLQHSFMSPYKRPVWYRRKKFYFNLVRRTMAEFLATGLFVFVAVSSVGNVSPDGWNNVRAASATVVGLAHGMAYAALVAATMHVSGGHLNPAVSLGVFIAGGLNILALLCYFVAQVLGGLAGAACVLAYDSLQIYDNGTWTMVDYGVTTLAAGIHPGQGILIELVLVMMLVMVFIHTTGEQTEYRPIAPIAIGFALASCVMASFNMTGGSLNPVRSLGPAVVGSAAGRWKNHYVYWIGPLLGSLLAGLFYRLFLSSKPLIPLAEEEPPPTKTHNHNQ